MVPSDIENLPVPNGGGPPLPLSSFVNLEQTVGPSEIHRFNRLRSSTISAGTAPDVPLGEAIAELEQFMSSDQSPPGVDYTFTGMADQFEEAFFYLILTLVLSILFIYLVLAAQFESFIQPLTIMLALPLALVGAFGSLWLLAMPISIFVFIGIIMLMGLVTKNSILLIDYTNVLVGRGRTPVEAAKEAAQVRFRPVVMTAISTMQGMIPLALGVGAGADEGVLADLHARPDQRVEREPDVVLDDRAEVPDLGLVDHVVVV
jgi:multidrug efflux pump subunit AcrB